MKIYPHTDFDLKTIKHGEFELIELKQGWLSERNILPVPHRHMFYEIVWITEGEDFHMVDYQNYRLRENHLLVIPKNSIHDFKPKDTTRGWKLIFDENFFVPKQLPLLSDFHVLIPCLGDKAIQMNSEEVKVVNSTIALLKTLKGNRQKQNTLLNLLMFVEDCYQSKIQEYDLNFVNFLKLLNLSIYQHNNIEYYSNKLNISDKKLNQIVKQATGETTKSYIHSRLVNEAKSKLSYSNLSIKEVAYSLGFNDALYFSRFFKNKTKISPEEYRKSYS